MLFLAHFGNLKLLSSLMYTVQTNWISKKRLIFVVNTAFYDLNELKCIKLHNLD